MDAKTKRLVAKTLIITPSGALSPGPLSASAIAIGAYLGVLGGLLVSVGHMLVELPYVIMLTVTLGRVKTLLKRFEKFLVLFVSAFLVFFGILLIQAALEVWTHGSFNITPLYATPTAAMLTGILLTGCNPYFLLWWVTVALPLIMDAAEIGRRGLVVMYVSHVWIDYVWLMLLAVAGSMARLINPLVYSALLAILAVLMFLFACDFLLKCYAGKRLLPF